MICRPVDGGKEILAHRRGAVRFPAASLQFVRKLSGYNAPSKANEAAFEQAIDEVFTAARRLFVSLETNATPRDREIEAEKAKQRAAERFGVRA
jgi:hypothetical protein